MLVVRMVEGRVKARRDRANTLLVVAQKSEAKLMAEESQALKSGTF
jgi:hypothetical protein